jgi:hypothetical protein
MGLLNGGMTIIDHERGVDLAEYAQGSAPVLGLCWLQCPTLASAPSRFFSGSGNGAVQLMEYQPETGT